MSDKTTQIRLGKNNHVYYDNLYDFLEDVKSNQPLNHGNLVGVKFWNKYPQEDPAWFGVKSEFKIEELLEVMNNGWADGLERLNNEIRASNEVDRPVSLRRRKARGDFGDAIDMQAVYSGNLNKAWQRTVRANRVGIKRITLVADSIVNGAMHSDSLFYRGAAVIKLADALTSAGYDVAIYTAFQGTTYASETFGAKICVKQFSNPLDLSTATAACCHPAMFRLLGHKWLKLFANEEYNSSGVMVDKYTTEDGEYACDANTKKDANEWVEATLKKITGE